MDQVAFLFSGRGAETPGMGKPWMEYGGAAAEVFKQADRVQPGTAHQCLQETPGALQREEEIQPYLFCIDLAAAMALVEAGVFPSSVAGFSLGELPAAAFAGLLSRDDAFRLLLVRAKACAAMQQDGHGLTAQQMAEALHTPAMNGVQREMEAFALQLPLQAPVMRLYANKTGERYRKPYQETLCSQISSPILWQETLQSMWRDGVRIFIEVGAGQRLRDLVSQQLPEAIALAVSDPATVGQVLQRLEQEL